MCGPTRWATLASPTSLPTPLSLTLPPGHVTWPRAVVTPTTTAKSADPPALPSAMPSVRLPGATPSWLPRGLTMNPASTSTRIWSCSAATPATLEAGTLTRQTLSSTLRTAGGRYASRCPPDSILWLKALPSGMEPPAALAGPFTCRPVRLPP